MSEYHSRDPIALGVHYARHLQAMTEEGLHSKADIAAELAWRDVQIERLWAEVSTLRATRLGRAPTFDEMDAHAKAGSMWMVRKRDIWEVVYLDRFRWPEGWEVFSRWCSDAIPLDSNRQPCPVGGGRGTP